MRIPQEVVISQKKLTQMTTTSELIDTTDTELFKEVESQVPTELWSQHDSDVGLIKSANPVRIQLKPDARLPRKSQYPLRPDAEAGIRNTIEGLVKAGVLTLSPPLTKYLIKRQRFPAIDEFLWQSVF